MNTASASPRIALITGASRGLGAALAEALAPTHHIVAVGKTVGALEAVDDKIQAAGGSATLAPLDVTKSDAVAQLCRGMFDRWGGADLWLHTAIHAAPLAPAGHVDGKDWEKSLALNATATQMLITMIEPLLRARQGRAVFFDDPRAGQKFFGAYGASKAAQIALARSWQAETAALPDIGVEIVTPPPMPTATRARFFPGEDRGPLTDPRQAAAAILAELGL